MNALFDQLTSSQKRLILISLLGGGTAISGLVKSAIKTAQKEQRLISKDLETKQKQRESAGVDGVFLQRLWKILSICVPSPLSKESMVILVQGLVLFLRTMLTLRITKLEGKAARYLTSQNFDAFYRNCIAFGIASVPAAIVNSLLKYLQKHLQIRFQTQLTKHLHAKYCSNHAYYAASHLRSLTNPDQRLTEDVEKFAFSITELYNYTFKPLLDVMLFTRALAPTMGYKGQFALYGYYITIAMILRLLSPPLSKMAAQEAALAGGFRQAHQRLSTRSEEVAYNDPPGGLSEELILNEHLQKSLRYVSLSSFQRCIQQIFDGFLVKYMASTACLIIYALPLQCRQTTDQSTQGMRTQDYIRSIRLLQNTSRGIGDLILVYKRLTTLAAHTSRVSVLLEQVDSLAQGPSSSSAMESAQSRDPHETNGLPIINPPRLQTGDHLKLENVSISSPDGTPLIQDLSFELTTGRSVLLMGPNGSGKSSLVRVLAGLWPIQTGSITCPQKGEILFLSQQAYLVTGTLRDQLLYPDPPRGTWLNTSKEDKRRFTQLRGRGLPPVDESRLHQCLHDVELEYLLERGQGWNHQQKWEDVLSGGEKQRLAMARLLYHKPRFAVLDEATSAVSVEGEQKLYNACQAAGISLLSIGNCHTLKQFHQMIIHVKDGYCEMEELHD
eukprot:g4198.t1